MNEKDMKYLLIRRIALTVLCIALAVILVVMIGATVYAVHLLDKPQSAETDHLQTEPAAEKTDTLQVIQEDFQEITEPAMEIGDATEETAIRKTDDPIVNILLIGHDCADQTGARSDAMILCTFNTDENTIVLTSFLRDLYVKIPGYRKNRINAAFSFGGAQLLNQTLEENFGVNVDGNVMVDFKSFRKIVDLLGGVTVDLTEREVRYMKKHDPDCDLTVGENLLNGKQALLYARNRYDVDGDFSRTNRQRKLLDAMICAWKDKKLGQTLSVLREVLPMVTTDISKPNLKDYVVTLFPMLAEATIKTQSIPVAGAYHNATIDDMAVLVPDLEKNRRALEEILQ